MGDAAMWAWGPAGHALVSIMSDQAPTLSRVEQRLARFLILAHWQQLDRSFTFVYSPFDPLPLRFSICYICTRKAGTDRVVSKDCDSCWLILIVVMQCLQSPVAHLSVLERQRFSSRWQQQGQEQPSHHSYHRAADLCVQGLNPFDCFTNGLPNLPQYSLAAAPSFEETSVAVSDSSFRKRKAETSPKSKQDLGKVESNCKRVKQETGGGAKSESKQQNSRKEASGDSSKKDEETPKTDYIHVRARRGQATDSHSLAERVRRERISQRMKYLQELVPGCSKITGKAGMLDEIINYVQSLQRQVEFLSMKLAAVNPMAEINFSSGEATMTQLAHINPPSRSSSMGISSELMDQPFLHFDSLQLHPCSGMDMYMDSSDLVPDGSSFGSCNNFNGLYRVEFQLGRGTAAFPFQSLQGNLLPNNLKMEI